MAINYFTCQGYTVSLPLNDTQWYDLIIEKDDILKTESGEISLRNTGGTKGAVYDNIINHSELDFLFCVNKNLNMWCIPVKDILKASNRNRIVLRNTPTINNQGFQTYKYQVQILDKA